MVSTEETEIYKSRNLESKIYFADDAPFYSWKSTSFPRVSSSDKMSV